MRPLLRYFGGKSLLAQRLINLMPQAHSYVEPYCGSASVLLARERVPIEVLNDRDGLVVNVLRCVRDDKGRLFELLEHTPYARDEYVAAAHLHNDPWEQARRTIVRSFMGLGADAIHHDSGFRGQSHNKKRDNDSTCAQEWSTYLDAWPTFQQRLRGVLIENTDALDIIVRFDNPNALFYIDPPYVFDTRVDGRNRYGHEMTDEDHQVLLRQLLDVQGMVVLSGYRHPLYDELLEGWMRTDIDFRGKVESVWRNPSAIRERVAPTLFDAVETLFEEK